MPRDRTHRAPGLTAPRPRSIILRLLAPRDVAGDSGRGPELRAAIASARASDDPGFAAIVAVESPVTTMAGDYDSAHAAAEQASGLKGNTTRHISWPRHAGKLDPRRPAGPPTRAYGLVTAIVTTVETTRATSPGLRPFTTALPRVSAALGADHPLTSPRRRQALIWARTVPAPCRAQALAAATPTAGRGDSRSGEPCRSALAQAKVRAPGDRGRRARRFRADRVQPPRSRRAARCAGANDRGAWRPRRRARPPRGGGARSRTRAPVPARGCTDRVGALRPGPVRASFRPPAPA